MEINTGGSLVGNSSGGGGASPSSPWGDGGLAVYIIIRVAIGLVVLGAIIITLYRPRNSSASASAERTVALYRSLERREQEEEEARLLAEAIALSAAEAAEAEGAGDAEDGPSAVSYVPPKEVLPSKEVIAKAEPGPLDPD
jgi:hypothetical protein